MIKSVFKSGSLQVLGFGAGFLVHILLARMLGVAEYGIYNFIFAVSTVLAMFAMSGLQQSVTRLTQDCFADDRRGHLAGLMIFARSWPVLIGLLLGTAVYAGLFSFGVSIGPEHLVAAIALVPLLALLRVQSGVLRSFEKISASVFFNLGYHEIVFALVLLAGVSVVSAQAALLVLVVIVALGVLAAGGYAVFVSMKHIGAVRPEYDTKGWLSISLPMMMTVATRMLMVRTDLIILGVMMSVADLGVYAAAAKVAMLMALAQMAVMPFFAPKVAQFYKAGLKNDLRRLFFKAQGLQALGGAVLLIVFLIAGEHILEIFGPEYSVGYNVLMILAVGQFIGVASGPASALLEMTAYEKTAMKIVMICAGANVILTLILVYLVGLEGAALATTLAFVAQNIAAYVMARRKGLMTGGAYEA